MSVVNGYWARWRGTDYPASPDGELVRIYATSPVAGFEQVRTGRYRRFVPRAELENFIARVRPLYSKLKIRGFAAVAKVHPGIVVGQLQHRGQISYAHNREMLAKVRDILTNTTLTDGWGKTAPSL